MLRLPNLNLLVHPARLARDSTEPVSKPPGYELGRRGGGEAQTQLGGGFPDGLDECRKVIDFIHAGSCASACRQWTGLLLALPFRAVHLC
jgi:hypothetical protein